MSPVLIPYSSTAKQTMIASQYVTFVCTQWVGNIEQKQ
jgi:hypothetical protein